MASLKILALLMLSIQLAYTLPNLIDVRSAEQSLTRWDAKRDLDRGSGDPIPICNGSNSGECTEADEVKHRVRNNFDN